MFLYTQDDPTAVADQARECYRAYLERLRATDFRRSPALPRYFVLHFFNDGRLARFDYDPRANTLVLEMESVSVLNDVYDLRARLGMPREMPHRCEDFSYTCSFRGVAYLQVRRTPMRIENAQTGEVVHALPRHRLDDDYQHGEILESPLARELGAAAGVPLFHLRFETGWAKQVEVVFQKVIVRKVNDVRYESYTGGKRLRLSRLFRG
jgi:hypothetical protein